MYTNGTNTSVLMKSWVIVLSVILCVLHHSHVKAQPDSIRHDRLLNQRSVREKLRVTITPSVGIGLVSGDLEGQDGLVRYVKPGVAVSGMVKVLLQPSDPQKRFGLGLLSGITASVGEYTKSVSGSFGILKDEHLMQITYNKRHTILVQLYK